MPKISITIPAYQNVTALQRLLDSIATQTFTDYEVVITDDTPDSSVKDFVTSYQKIKHIKYYKNLTPLGTPENWNEGIRKASGEWIKIMHHDDWFSSNDSIKQFDNLTKNQSGIIFSGYHNVNSNGVKSKVIAGAGNVKQVVKNPWLLFVKNTIGPPSTTLVHRSNQNWFDPNLKWFVDIEFYIRYLQNKNNLHFCNNPLINIGIHDAQVTKTAFRNAAIELPEAQYLINRYGIKPLQSISVYDSWWRLFRNVNIFDAEKLFHYTSEEWPPLIMQMIADMKRHANQLSNGLLSKSYMLQSYIKNRKYFRA